MGEKRLVCKQFKYILCECVWLGVRKWNFCVACVSKARSMKNLKCYSIGKKRKKEANEIYEKSCALTLMSMNWIYVVDMLFTHTHTLHVFSYVAFIWMPRSRACVWACDCISLIISFRFVSINDSNVYINCLATVCKAFNMKMLKCDLDLPDDWWLRKKNW